MNMKRGLAAVLGAAIIAMGWSARAQSGGQQDPPVIVIPPATIGLDAAPEELREALDESVLPQTVPELLTELAKRAQQIQQTISAGALNQVWVPAMSTKTAAIVLESHTASFP